MTALSTLKHELALIGKRLSDRGLVAGTDGNISVRIDDDRVLITPGGVAKGRLTPESIVMVDLSGKKLDGEPEPSSELLMHLFVYRKRQEICACVHAHPPYATAFAVAGRELPEDVLPEVVVFVGRIPLTDYAAPGTSAVPEALEPDIGSCNAFLLRNHGLLTLGRNLEEAYNRHETVEHYARILLYAEQMGDVNRLPRDDFTRLAELRRRLAESDERQD